MLTHSIIGSGTQREILLREAFLEFILSKDKLFALLMHAEESGVLRINDAKDFGISREIAQQLGKILVVLELFKFEVGIGYVYLGTSSLALIYNGMPL